MKIHIYIFLVFIILSVLATAQDCESSFDFEIDSTQNIVSFHDLSTVDSLDAIEIWEWNFGNSSFSYEQNPSHEFFEGVNIVCLTILTRDSCTSTFCDSIFISNIVDPCDNIEISYEVTPATTEYSDDGAIDLTVENSDSTFFHWVYSEDYMWEETTEDISNLEIGYYTVYIYGEIDSIHCNFEETIYVYSNDSIGDCEAYFTYQENPQTNDVYFEDLSMNNYPIVEWFWSFGDGETSSEQNPTHEYAEGMFEVCLTIVVEDSCFNTFCDSIFIESDPCEDFIFENILVSNESHIGNQDGEIDISISGGLVPFHYEWDNYEYSEDITNLSSGQYCIEIIDANMCIIDTCLIVNTDEDSVLLYSVSGEIYTGENLLISGFAELFNANLPEDNGYIYTTEINSGIYNFTEIESGEYKLLASPTSVIETNIYKPTYFGNKDNFEDAYTLNVISDIISLDISLMHNSDISEYENHENILLYPNPANQNITIKSFAENIKYIEIIDVTGRKVYESINNSKNIFVDLSSLVSGVYYVKIDFDRRQIVQKISIIR